MTNEQVLTIKKPEFQTSTPEGIRKYLEPIEQPVSVHEDGRINEECPCIHSALAHRCGFLLRDALRCFNNSTTKPRGMDCEKEFVSHIQCVDNSQ